MSTPQKIQAPIVRRDPRPRGLSGVGPVEVRGLDPQRKYCWVNMGSQDDLEMYGSLGYQAEIASLDGVHTHTGTVGQRITYRGMQLMSCSREDWESVQAEGTQTTASFENRITKQRSSKDLLRGINNVAPTGMPYFRTGDDTSAEKVING
jgi:hypothetical protein